MNNVYFPVPNHTTNPMSLFEDPDCSVLGCPESCICEGVGLGPAVNLNKDPKKCFRLTAKTIIKMFREGSNGVQKKEIKQYLRDSDLRFTHTLFDIVDASTSSFKFESRPTMVKQFGSRAHKPDCLPDCTNSYTIKS